MRQFLILRFFIAMLALWMVMLFAHAQQATTAPLFRFVQISDSHVLLPEDTERSKDFGGRIYSRSCDILTGAVAFLTKELHPDFVIHSGDMVENGGFPAGVKSMSFLKDLFAARKLTFFPTFGNHEVDVERYRQVFGLTNYTYTCGNLTFVHLQVTNIYQRMPNQRVGMISKDVLYQLDDLLSYTRGPVIIVLHEPLVCNEAEASWARPYNYTVTKQLLARYANVLLVMQGHVHYFNFQQENGISYVTCPGLVDTVLRADPDLVHCFLAYDVYANRIEVALYGAVSTEAASKGDYHRSAKVTYSIPVTMRGGIKAGTTYRTGLVARPLPEAVPQCDLEIEQDSRSVVRNLDRGWIFRTDPDNKGVQQDWFNPTCNEQEWKALPAVGLPWESGGIAPANYDGFGWYRIHFTLPLLLHDAKLLLVLGRIYDADETYLNGVRIGTTGVFPPDKPGADTRREDRAYVLPIERLQFRQENVIAVRVYNAAGEGGLRSVPYICFAGH